jgi:hypothetical protein
MDWLENNVFCAVSADGCALKIGYNDEERCFLLNPYQDVISRTIWDIHQSSPEAHLTLHGQNIPFVNDVKYLGVNFDKRITWRLHIEMSEVKAFRTFIRIYPLFRSEHLSANIKYRH